MGVFNTRRKTQNTHRFSKMKVQFILAACLAAAAFAAPIDNFVDPDCIEEDAVFEEPAQDINAQFALGVPDLILTPGQVEGDDNCVDELGTEAPAAPAQTEECEDPIETTEDPEMTTAEECVDEPTEAAPADECEDEGNEVAPALDMRIEAAPAVVVEDIKFYGEENMIPDIEECEE